MSGIHIIINKIHNPTFEIDIFYKKNKYLKTVNLEFGWIQSKLICLRNQ